MPSPPPGVKVGLRRVPVPARGHHPGGALVPAVRPVLQGRRRAPRRARHRGRPREHLPVGPAVRARVRGGGSSPSARHRGRWYVDETYVKVGGTWRYLFRAIDQLGQVIDVFLSPRRNSEAARRFFARAMGRTRVSPVEVTTDRYRVYPRVLDELLPAAFHDTEVNANNRIETDHGRLKGPTSTDARAKARPHRQGHRRGARLHPEPPPGLLQSRD
jgi:IS1 family transposase